MFIHQAGPDERSKMIPTKDQPEKKDKQRSDQPLPEREEYSNDQKVDDHLMGQISRDRGTEEHFRTQSHPIKVDVEEPSMTQWLLEDEDVDEQYMIQQLLEKYRLLN